MANSFHHKIGNLGRRFWTGAQPGVAGGTCNRDRMEKPRRGAGHDHRGDGRSPERRRSCAGRYRPDALSAGG